MWKSTIAYTGVLTTVYSYLALIISMSLGAVHPPPSVQVQGHDIINTTQNTTTPNVPFPGGREVLESASWLSKQQLPLWFTLITVLFGILIFFVIKWLLKQLTEQRIANEGLVRSLIEYLQKDHQQTVILVKESQLVMQEVVNLLHSIQQEKHDEKVLEAASQGHIHLTQ